MFAYRPDLACSVLIPGSVFKGHKDLLHGPLLNQPINLSSKYLILTITR